MKCDEIRALLATRGQLSFAQEREVQVHLAICSRCATAWQHEERIMRQFRALPVPPGELPEHAKMTIRMALRARHPARSQRIRRVIFAGIALAILLLVMLLQPDIQRYIVQTAGVGNRAVPTPSGVFPMPVTSSSGTLYIASSITSANAQEIVGARVTAVDLTPWHERYRVEGGDEATLSPDGARLYVAGTLPGSTGSDALRAIDAQTGREIWHVPIQHRAGYPGHSNLVVSPDGHWLYLRSRDVTSGSGEAGTVPFWLQIIDTTTGAILPKTIPLPNIYSCPEPTLASPPVGIAVYLSCYNNSILAINTQTQQIEPLLPHEVNGTILAPTQREMYAVNEMIDLFTLDSVQRTLIRKVTMHPKPSFFPDHLLVALSSDGKRLVRGQTIEGSPGTATACEIRVLDTSTGEEVGRFRYEQPLYSFVVDATGARLYAVIGALNTTIVEFDLPSGAVRAKWERPEENITQMFIGR